MARTINEQEYAARRKEILDAAQRLVYTKGYERMTVQDIQAELKISSGAFYHYFRTKPAVLEALVEQMQVEAEKPMLPILNDPGLPATEKLRRCFGVLEGERSERRAFILQLVRTWYADDNAIVRVKVAEAILKRRGPLIEQIIRQGIAEGVFRAAHPAQMSQVILTLANGMGDAVARLMLRAEAQLMLSASQPPEQEPGSAAHPLDFDPAQLARCIDEIVATQVSFTEAMEHALGASMPFLNRLDAETLRGFLNLKEFLHEE